MGLSDAPSTCRSCAFLVKCFAANDESVVRSTVLPNEYSSYPLQLGQSTLRVMTQGQSGSPVVFVHSEGGSADRFAFNLNAFARAGYRAYAIDMPGHGLSSKSRGGPASVPDYAGVLGAFLNHIGERAVLVGVSIGAHIAAYCATQLPAFVEALIMVGGGGLVPLGSDHRARLRRMITYRSAEGGRERLRRCLYDPRLAAGDIVEQEFRSNTSPGAPEILQDFGDYIDQRIDEDVVGPRLRRVVDGIPCLLVWGAEDKVLPESFGRASCEVLDESCSFATIEKAGHAPHFERPGEFNQLLLEFLHRELPPYRRKRRNRQSNGTVDDGS